MTSKFSGSPKLAFEPTTLRLPIDAIMPLRAINPDIRRTPKYSQIAASIREVGIIEPPVVVREPNDSRRFRLLDGHIRLDILRNQNETEVVCLVATEDEAFTYNRQINRVATVQEHKMILKAIKQGVPEDRLARALNVNIKSIRRKRDLLKGICEEVAELLRNRHVPINAFYKLRRLKPMRQIAAAEMMVAMNNFSVSYVESIVAASPPDQLVDQSKPKKKGLSQEQIDLMTHESARLDREFKSVEQNFGSDHLELVLAAAYLARLLENARVVRHLAEYHPDLLKQFQNTAQIATSVDPKLSATGD